MKKFYYPSILLFLTSLACQALSGPAATPLPPVAVDQGGSSTTGDGCSMVVGNYDLPHSATEVGGQEFYDLAAAGTSQDTYLQMNAVVTETAHLVSESDGVDGTLVFAYIDDVEGNATHQFFVLIYLPDGGLAVNAMPVDSRLSASGLFVGYVYPPANLFAAFPNEQEDTKFPSIKAEMATYGC